MAMRMGEGNQEEAKRILSNCFMLLTGLSVVLTTLFLLSKDQLLMWFGASPATFGYADTYMTIYTAGTFFALMATGMNSFLICQGFSGLGMGTVVLGAALNIILDPVFIFVCNLGVAGAALATVLSQMASCAFVLGTLLRKRMPVRLSWGQFTGRIVRRVLSFGLSPFLIIATDSVLLIILNALLQHYGGPKEGDTLVTCATIVQSYLLIITMPMGGLTGGCQPVISFNYGAGRPDRIKQALKCIITLCLGFALIMTLVTQLACQYFVRLFNSDPEILARSVSYIKIFTAMILPLAIQYPLVDETTALGQVRLALFCSMFRKCVFLAGLFLLPAMISAQAIFYAEPIADLVSATMITCLCLRFFPKILAQRTPV